MERDLNNIFEKIFEVTIGGEVKKFNFRYSSFRYMTIKYGGMKKFLEMAKSISETSTPEDEAMDFLINFIFAGLKTEDKFLTVEKLEDTISFTELYKFGELVPKVLTESSPVKEVDLNNPTLPGKN